MKDILTIVILAISLTCLLGMSTMNSTGLAEICDNGIDDDGDQLIDLNDPDCDCPEAELISYIPNPSFEENTCCPSSRSQMNCADTWIQASEATTDYIHTCGWLGWDEFTAPRPFPDGQAIVGFRDGRTGGPNNPDGNANWKEYTGACLLQPLKKGTEYRFEFWIGFADNINSPPINVTFFGTADCDNLPFGIGDEEFGCPSNDPNWKRLGSVQVFGNNEWRKVSLRVVPAFDVKAMAIGPECFPYERMNNTYYFFDNLVLASQEEFDFKISADAHPCDDNFSLSIPLRDDASYQWYRDGIAIVGATRNVLKNITSEGSYNARIISDLGCLILPAYIHTIPAYETVTSEAICQGESFPFKDQELITAGDYTTTFKDRNNCDSLVTLSLTVQSDEPEPASLKIFETNEFKSGRYTLNTEGLNRLYLNSTIGCDSIIDLDLQFYKVYIPNVFSPNGDGINDYFEIGLGDEAVQIEYLHIYNRWGEKIFQTNLNSDSPEVKWNGKSKQQQLLTGSFVYDLGLRDINGTTVSYQGSLMIFK